MFIKRAWPLYLDKDEGAGAAAANGKDKPTGDPAGNGPTGAGSSADWRDARIHELNEENATRRRENKSLNDKVLELTGQLAQLQTTMQQKERTAQEAVLRFSVTAAAATAGFHDPADAWSMLDRSALKVDEGGAVEGLEEALKKIAEGKPYLLKSTPAADPAAPPPAKPQPSPGNPAKPTKLTVEAIAKMTPQEIAKRFQSDPDFAKQIEEAQRST